MELLWSCFQSSKKISKKFQNWQEKGCQAGKNIFLRLQAQGLLLQKNFKISPSTLTTALLHPYLQPKSIRLSLVIMLQCRLLSKVKPGSSRFFNQLFTIIFLKIILSHKYYIKLSSVPLFRNSILANCACL